MKRIYHFILMGLFCIFISSLVTPNAYINRAWCCIMWAFTLQQFKWVHEGTKKINYFFEE